ncbi:MAG: dienelactone hydrolase family protein [Candidatus Pacebacteria bacterium]|nr:dienelactone hydrolase family protein [Candidatus Paceibacterota bacterium]
MCTVNSCDPSAAAVPPPDLPDPLRRRFLQGLAILPLATVLYYPELARAQAMRMSRGSLPLVGGNNLPYAEALPSATKAPVVILIHEWWGLNDQILAVTQEFANQGFVALAVDLYDGKVAKSPEEAKNLTGSIDIAATTAKLKSIIDFARNHPRGNGKVGTIGWCFGGGWSLAGSIAAPVEATVIYYGRCTQKSAELATLKGPVLGHFGTEDKGINQAMVAGFEAEMKLAQKDLTVHWYPANHAFANPSSANYNEASARLSWERSLGFLKSNLSGG